MNLLNAITVVALIAVLAWVIMEDTSRRRYKTLERQLRQLEFLIFGYNKQMFEAKNESLLDFFNKKWIDQGSEFVELFNKQYAHLHAHFKSNDKHHKMLVKNLGLHYFEQELHAEGYKKETDPLPFDAVNASGKENGEVRKFTGSRIK